MLHNITLISYVLSIIGLILFLFSQNIFSILKVPRFKFSNLFTGKDGKFKKILPKDPIINTSKVEEYNGETGNVSNREENKKSYPDYLSPSLEILDAKDQPLQKNR